MTLLAHLTSQDMPLSIAVLLVGVGFGVVNFWALVGYLRSKR